MYEPNNIFSKIIKGQIPAEILYEDDHVLAFPDIKPAAPVHILVIPKGEYSDYDDFIQKANEQEKLALFNAIAHIAREHNLDKSGYRLVSNKGHDANQTVMHFHVHILAGRNLGMKIVAE